MRIVTLLLVCLWHGFARGHSDNYQRVIGGDVAPSKFRPFVASIQEVYFAGYNPFCSGSIIKLRWVLTAGHCVATKQVQSLRVVVGREDLTSRAGFETFVNHSFVHPQYKKTQEVIWHDLALLFLSSSLPVSSTIHLVALAPLGFYTGIGNDDYEVMALGFGRTYQGPKYRPKNMNLMSVLLKTMPIDECKAAHATVGNYVDEKMHICAWSEEGKTLCFGDSGGPLIEYPIGLQVGVFSGLQDCTGKFPVLFMNLEMYFPWIDNVTDDSSLP